MTVETWVWIVRRTLPVSIIASVVAFLRAIWCHSVQWALTGIVAVGLAVVLAICTFCTMDMDEEKPW